MKKLTTAGRRRRRGQSLIEYILMTAMLATLSLGFTKFFGHKVLGESFRRLPAKLSVCVSTLPAGSARDCQ